MKKYIGQGMKKGGGASLLSPEAPFSPDLHDFTNLEAGSLKGIFFFFFFKLLSVPNMGLEP